MDDLTRWLGISRSSLYSLWQGKEELFRSAFARYLRTIGMEALKPLEHSGAARPQEVLERVFENVARQVGHDPLSRGCLMVNTLTELTATDPDLARIAHDAKDQLRALFRAALQPLVDSGEKTNVQADIDADYLLTLFMGMRVLARTSPDPAKAEAVARRGLQAVFS